MFRRGGEGGRRSDGSGGGDDDGMLGAMDAMENAMHNLDVVKLMCCPEEELLLASLRLRELLVLRIMHNALETVTTCGITCGLGLAIALHLLRSSFLTCGTSSW